MTDEVEAAMTAKLKEMASKTFGPAKERAIAEARVAYDAVLLKVVRSPRLTLEDAKALFQARQDFLDAFEIIELEAADG